ncbi:DNA adenine methylase [Vagococcus penaei]|nr:Dam family site-specific DNA-(adenine-N6)-methyltransferase [Vagococcus penaei]MBO0436213.1 Dam family site-specific DNA-(adenine-N6)-methyltransferase [Vagococcus fluvialis]RST98349.1 DNA adenine methylase [Vagococcus penaei]
MPKTTKQIEVEYGVSRQTLHNWINEGLLLKPQKDFRNWFIWNTENEKNLEEIIKRKSSKNNIPKNQEVKLKISNRRYLGSKQKLLYFIEEVVENNTKDIEVVADVFGGTGIVSELFRAKGKRIIVNDILHSNYISYNTWFGNQDINMKKIEKKIEFLNSLNPTEENYVSENFGDKYFSMKNARKIGAIREEIETFELNKREKDFLLTSLLYAMDKVANTVGHYDAYRKNMDSLQPIKLLVPEFNMNFNNEVYCEDANELVKKIKADLVYIDTPYNSRQYGDAYHLLENIMDWQKPSVVGVAKKMVDRSHIKSDYSLRKAPEAFDDLISNIDSKYILVSYNNMAKKGNARSNAKISNEDILKTLRKRGNVQVFETDFQYFTTGKTNLENHKELLYLCEIKGEIEIKKTEFVKSPINYTGGKHKLLPQIMPLFPANINTFYDVFGGGANVGINVNQANAIIINDIENHLIDLFQYIQVTKYPLLLEEINRVIDQYNLSNTKKYGYEYYKVNSSIGLKNINKNNYEMLRRDFNEGKIDSDSRALVFYVLLVYGFNNQIRFNGSGYFNMPTGKRDFNKNMESKLKQFKNTLDRMNIKFTNKDFRKVLSTVTNVDDFVYLDPPYLISTASYNENNGWSYKDEKDLLVALDGLNDRGIRFALSNVVEHKGITNDLLIEWSKKYNVHILNHNYNNSNYQSKAKKNITTEVLITNY